MALTLEKNKHPYSDYCGFEVRDYSRKARIKWHLLLEKILVKNRKNNEYIFIYFKYNYTLLERIVAAALERNGAKFFPQFPIGNFLIDFYIQPNIVIEVDGPVHESDEQRRKDQIKDRILGSRGFRVKRISYGMVENLSLAIVSGELLPIDSDEENCLSESQSQFKRTIQ